MLSIDKNKWILDNKTMGLKEKLNKLWQGFENLIFTNHACLSCRREIEDGTEYSLCKNCNKNLERIGGVVCKTCGEKILEGNTFCDRCKQINYDFDYSNSFAEYGEIASRIIKRFKYNGKKYYADFIAELMLENDNYFDYIDIITFVPISDKRKKERGFNQAEEIAKILGEKLHTEVVDILEKVGSGKHQAGLSQKDRRKNLAGTFELKEDVKKLIKDKNVMIIDDVFTTGSTLSECAKALRSSRTNKPEKVCCYTFAKTRLDFTKNGQNQQNN